MSDKLRENFADMVVYKDLGKMSFLKTLKLPAFLRDWVLRKFEDDDGQFDVDELLEFVSTYMPRKEEWLSIKNRISKEYERVKLLTRISTDIDIKTNEVSFSLPDYGLMNRDTVIEDDVWVGAHSIILKGVTIGARSIIGAGSVVTKNIPPDCVAAGNPCRVIKSLK